MNSHPDLSVSMWEVDHALKLVDTGRLGLPDFQRRFEWTSTDVKAFLSTVLTGLPSGTLMVAENRHLKISLRPLEGARDLGPVSPHLLVLLDGQQRLTALFQALNDLGPERYAVDFSALMGGADILQDNVIVAVPGRLWENRQLEARTNGQTLVPFSALRNPSTFYSWLSSAAIVDKAEALALGEVFAQQIQAVANYRIPVTVLGGELSLATIAQVFERTNKWGQRLDAFDLLVARLQAGGWSLRSEWEDALQLYPEVGRVFAVNGLCTVSAISLLVASDVRRSAVLSLAPTHITKHWTSAAKATSDVAKILLHEGVRRPDLLPYDAIAIAMIAGRMAGVPSDLLAHYFWRASLNRRYETASNTSVVTDFRQLADGRVPRDLEELLLDHATVERNTRRSSKALAATLTALMLASNPLDLYSGAPLTSEEPDGIEGWELIPIAKGGSAAETEEEVPMRLRTAAQVFVSPSTRRRIRSSGLLAVVRNRSELPALFGPTIDDCLQSQLMPNSFFLLDGNSLADIVRTRSTKMIGEFARRAGWGLSLA